MDPSTGYVALEKWIGGVETTLGHFTTTITAGTTYSVKIVALVNYFEVWWQGVRKIAVTDPSPPAQPISGYIQFWTHTTTTTLNVDDVRVWNTTSGTITSPARDAGATNRPLLDRITYVGGTFDWADSQILSSTDNVAWSDSHYVKVGPKSALDYAIAEGDQNRYYKVKVEVRSTDDSTPSLSEITTPEGTPTTPTPTVVLGYERWQYYPGGLALITDRNGNKLTLTYDGSSRLSRVTEDSGQYLEFLYDGNSRITTVRDETLRAWTYQYTSNRLTSVTDPLSNSTLYIYDASNRISTVVDRANKMTRIVYDASSRGTDLYLGLYNRTTSAITWQYRWYTISGYANTRTRTVTD